MLQLNTAEEPLVERCPNCGEHIVVTEEYKVIDGAPSFKIKGMRAANGYGLKFIDTPGVDKITGKETGHSFTSNRAQTTDNNQGDI